jgi:hypothetical protein
MGNITKKPAELLRIASDPKTTITELSQIHEYIESKSWRYISEDLLPLSDALLQNSNISVDIVQEYLSRWNIDTTSLLKNPSLSLLMLESPQMLENLNLQEIGRWLSLPELPDYVFPLLDTTQHWSGIEQYHVSAFPKRPNAPIETWFPLLRDFLQSIPVGYGAPLCRLKDITSCSMNSIAWLFKHFPAPFTPYILPANLPVVESKEREAQEMRLRINLMPGNLAVVEAESEDPYKVQNIEEMLALAYHPDLSAAGRNALGKYWVPSANKKGIACDFDMVVRNILEGDAKRRPLLMQPYNSFGTFARVCADIVPNTPKEKQGEMWFDGLPPDAYPGAHRAEVNWLVRLGTVACPETDTELLSSYLNDGIFFVWAMAQFRLDNPDIAFSFIIVYYTFGTISGRTP